MLARLAYLPYGAVRYSHGGRGADRVLHELNPFELEEESNTAKKVTSAIVLK